MSHHNHTHENRRNINFNKPFLIGIILNSIFIVTEIIYGIISDSLALLADAGHNFGDVVGLFIAWIATYLVNKKPTQTHTYGYKKSSILAAFVNALILFAAIGMILWEAFGRLFNPQPVQGSIVILVAGIGVVINTLTAFLFIKGKDKDINIKGAFLHMAADALVSFGVVLSGVLIVFTELYWIDPIISIFVAIVIFIGTWKLFTESANMALDAVPESVNKENVKVFLENVEGVIEIHDLHIWAMSSTEFALTVHLVIPDTTINDSFTKQVSHQLNKLFGIQHSTIQIENKHCQNECSAT